MPNKTCQLQIGQGADGERDATWFRKKENKRKRVTERERERERERDTEATTESQKKRKSDRETEIHATQCRGPRAVNGHVRKCNLMSLLRCSCEHVEMRRNGYHNEYHTIQYNQQMTMASNIPMHITMTPAITPTITSINKLSCHKKACA